MESTRIEFRQDHGRVVVAARNFALGEVVISEKPTLVWSTTDTGLGVARNYLRAFSAASPEAQEAVLDMFHPPVNSDHARSVLRSLGVIRKTNDASYSEETFLARQAGLDPSSIYKLLLIMVTNAHEYRGFDNDETYTEYMEGDSETQPEHGALFSYGSKVSHSCSPNVLYTTKNGAGHLQYMATRAIREGELITFSYIRAVWWTPRVDRREMLQLSKDYCYVFSNSELERIFSNSNFVCF